MSRKVGVNARTDYQSKLRAEHSAIRVLWTCVAHLERQTDPEEGLK